MERPGVDGAAVTPEQLTDDPHPHLHRLRAAAPVAWVPAVGGWLVTGRAAALEVLRDPDRFTVDDPRFTTGRVVGPSMLSLDGAEHARHRRPFVAPLHRAGSGGEAAAMVARHVGELVDRFADAGEADLRAGLAGPLPVAVIADVLGLRLEPTVLSGWYRAIVDAVEALTRDPSADVPDGLTDELAAAVLEAVATGAGLLGGVERSGLTDAELAADSAVVLFGAIETVEGMIANLLWHVLGDPRLLDALRTDPGLRDGAIEESLRLEPAAAVVDRYATADASLSGAPVAAGDLVRVSLAGANRDLAAHADPDRFEPRRPPSPPHLAFAVGPHACLGARLARLEARAALDAVLDRLPDVRLDPATTAPVGLVFRKPATLLARWTTLA